MKKGKEEKKTGLKTVNEDSDEGGTLMVITTKTMMSRGK